MNERWRLIRVSSGGEPVAVLVKSTLSSSDACTLCPWLLAHESGYDKPFAKCHGMS